MAAAARCIRPRWTEANALCSCFHFTPCCYLSIRALLPRCSLLPTMVPSNGNFNDRKINNFSDQP